MKKTYTQIILGACFALVFTTSATSTTLPPEHIKQTIRNFSEAVQAKDTAMLHKSISSRFAVSVATMPTSIRYMQTIFGGTVVDSIVPIDGTIIAQRGEFKQRTEAMVYPNGREPVKTHITFDTQEGKILYVDYFDGLYGMFRNRPARLVGVLPFEQTNGKDAIIVYLKINDYDKPLRFLFDTGADGMAISEEAAEKANVKPTRQQGTSVVGGNRQIMISEGNIVHIDTLQIRSQNIAIFEKVSEGIDGLLGLNLARNWIVNVNFDEKNIYLYTFGEFEYPVGGEIEYVATHSGVMHIPGFLNLTGNKVVNGDFVFDTGAEYYLMAFSPWVRRNRLLLSGGWKPEGEAATTSMGITTPTYEGTAYEFGFGEMIRQSNMPVSLQASSPSSRGWEPGVDGSVGIQLLSKYNFIINLVEKEVHFSLRK